MAGDRGRPADGLLMHGIISAPPNANMHPIAAGRDEPPSMELEVNAGQRTPPDARKNADRRHDHDHA